MMKVSGSSKADNGQGTYASLLPGPNFVGYDRRIRYVVLDGRKIGFPHTNIINHIVQTAMWLAH